MNYNQLSVNITIDKRVILNYIPAMNKKQNDYSIVKHNDLVEARYKLTLHEQKLVLNIAMMIKPKDKDFYEYRLSIRSFMDLMGVEGEGYHTRVRQKAKELLQKPLVIRRDHGGELICNWFSKIEYIKGAGEIVFGFDPSLKPYLLQLQKEFTEYKASNVMQLQSTFSIRLYELLKQYLTVGKRIFHLDTLKSILGIEDKYPLYANFKQKILEYCKKELKNRSNIQYEYEPIKTGRKVTEIKFLIFPNEKAESPEDPAEQAILEKVPLSARKAAKKAIKKRGIDGTQESLAYAEAKIKKGKVKDVAAYVATCLSNGYGAKTSAERTAEQEREARIAELRREADQLQQAADTETQRTKETVARQNALLAALTPEQDAEISRLAEQNIEAAGDYEKKRYRLQKKAGETTMLDRYKRGLIEEFTARVAPGGIAADPSKPQEMPLPGF